MMNKFFLALCAGFMTTGVAFGTDADNKQLPEAVTKAIPRKITVLIADVGTIDSVAQVDKWLGENLKPKQNINTMPAPDAGVMATDPKMKAAYFRWNMKTKQMEYARESREIQKENAENMKILRNIRLNTQSNANVRNVLLCKDWIQADLSSKYRKFIQVIDRGNIDQAMVEKAIRGDSDEEINEMAGAACTVTITMGDLEQNSRTIPVNAKGTKVKKTKFKQSYTGKLRDCSGNVLIAFDGISEIEQNQNNVIKSEFANPSRELMRKACHEIAKQIGDYFVTELKFKIKGPKSMADFDPEDVTVYIDGKAIDIDGKVCLIKSVHNLVAFVDGCKKIERIIDLSDVEPGAQRQIKLNFKKEEKTVDSKEDSE